MFYKTWEEAHRLDEKFEEGVDGMTLEELDKVLPNGYSIKDLSKNEQIILDFFLSSLDEVNAECTIVDDESTLMEKMLAEIAEDVLAEVKQNIVIRARDIAVELLDSKAK